MESLPKRKNSPRILFICGSMNQTTQMHKIAMELSRAIPESIHYFTPYYADGLLERFRRWGWLNFTILGNRSSSLVFKYCREHGLNIDYQGRDSPYDLVLTCADLIVPQNIRNSPIILIQEGMTDPEGWVYRLVRYIPILPRWVASTAMMGLSGHYERFCVASEDYRQLFIRKGAPSQKLIVTGIPNFDDCDEYLNNDFQHRDYFLVCTSDLRETFMQENRKKFILKAVELASRRPIIFKLHPNENWERARCEIEELAPGALIFTNGNTDHMIANCSGFLTHYSSTVFVALALGKEVHCDLDIEELKRLLPLQNRSAAKNITRVCREVLTEAADGLPKTKTHFMTRSMDQFVPVFHRGLHAFPK